MSRIWLDTGHGEQWGFPGCSVVKNVPVKKEIWVWSIGQEDPQEKEMATHSSILAWGIPLTEEEPVGLQSMRLQRVGHSLASTQQHGMGENGVSEGRFRFLACLLMRHHLKLNNISSRESTTFSCHKYQMVIAYMWNLKYDTNELIYETETDSRAQKTRLGAVSGGGEWGELDWEVGISRCKLFYREWLNNRVQLYITGNCVQHPVITIMENTMKNNVYIHV